MHYRIYKNLHNGLWSIKDKETGLVVAHAKSVIAENVKMVVSEAGRQRVLKEKRKNVHAYIEGVIVSAMGVVPFKGRNIRYSSSLYGVIPNEHTQDTKIGYNPYRGPNFTIQGEPINGAPLVILTETGVYSN